MTTYIIQYLLNGEWRNLKDHAGWNIECICVTNARWIGANISYKVGLVWRTDSWRIMDSHGQIHSI